MRRFLLSSAFILLAALAGCGIDQAETNSNASPSVMGGSHVGENKTYSDPGPGYSANGSYDDNGAAPPPNDGNQNFGRRW